MTQNVVARNVLVQTGGVGAYSPGRGNLKAVKGGERDKIPSTSSRVRSARLLTPREAPVTLVENDVLHEGLSTLRLKGVPTLVQRVAGLEARLEVKVERGPDLVVHADPD